MTKSNRNWPYKRRRSIAASTMRHVARFGIILTILLLAGCTQTATSGDILVVEAAPVSPVATLQPTVSTDAQLDEVAPEVARADAAGPVGQIDLSSLDIYQDVPVGFTEEGDPFRGDPNAPITFIEYSDYLCPFCGRYFNQTLPTLIDRYALTGQARFVFRDFPLVGLHPTAPIGHVSSLCVAEQGPALFWAMHDELFRTQQQWGALPDPTDFVATLAESIGADMAAYATCIATGDKQAEVDASVAAASALGFNGTPSFQFVVNETGAVHDLVGAYPVDEFSRWLDALVAGEDPPVDEEVEAEPAELPFWASAQGLVPNPDRPGFTLAGDPYKGNPDAKLVVVEFSDFQCPSCQRHALETQPAVDKRFVETGEVLWVFKPLPLREHANAPAAAVAAECAAEQGQFWEMHHLLFENLEQWSATDNPDLILVNSAEQLGLDVSRFTACLNSRRALERVLDDMYDAQGSVATTPTFVFLYGGRGHLSRGALPVDEFLSRLQDQLDQANAVD